MYQTNFNKNEAVNLRSKRLRHAHSILAKNLLIKSNKFNIWFTLHQSKTARAFYISEKKENDRNPKWHSLNSLKMSHKAFVLRIWYTNIEDNKDDTEELKNNKSGLNLLLEMDLNLDNLSLANESDQNYSSSTNLIVFEIFGKNFCEPLSDNNKEEVQKNYGHKKKTKHNKYKKFIFFEFNDPFT